MRRYDPSPLFDRLRSLGMSQAELARVLGCHRSTIGLWTLKGVGENLVDAAAVAVGRTPAELWPEWLDDQIAHDEAERRRVAAEKVRLLRAANPAYAERQRAYARRWKAESAEYVRAQRRAYYLANKQTEIASAAERKRRKRKEMAS